MKLSDAEWIVMSALWRRAPASARDVLENVSKEQQWAYTTVKTLLDRLVEKQAVAAAKRLNTIYYEPRITRRQARKTALQSLLDKAFDGAFGSLLQHMVVEEKLSHRDRDSLARMIQEMDRGKVER
jgi:BlaI family transcriptional regulator, penicillinase repressor